MAAKKSAKSVEEVAASVALGKDPVVASRQLLAESAIKGLTANDIVKKIGDLGLSVQSQLDAAKNRTLESLREYNDLQEAIELAKSQLAEVHGKDTVQATINELVAEHEGMLETYAAQEADLAARIAADAAAHDKLKARTEAEYKYDTELARKLEADDYSQSLIKRQRDADSKFDANNARWAAQEAELAAKEAEYKKAIELAAQVPAMIDSAVKREVAIVTNSLTRESKHAAELAAIENRNQVALLQQQVRSVNEQNESLRIQLEAYASKLESSEKRVETIAVNAMQSASGRNALDAVQQNIAATSGNARPSK